MESPKPLSLVRSIRFRRTLFSLGCVLFLLLALEIATRAFYYYPFNPSSIALARAATELKNLLGPKPPPPTPDGSALNVAAMMRRVRPHLTPAQTEQIEAEHQEAFAEYQPWVQFAWSHIRGKYVNHDGLVRKTVPDASTTQATEYFTVYFLGGSTMFGARATDEETVPAYFVKEYQRRFPSGKPIKVVNYGSSYYYSYHELMLLTDRLFNDERPDVVIALDGLNDFNQVYSSYLRHPFFTPRLQSLMNPAIRYHPDGFSYYQTPNNEPEDQVFKRILFNLIGNISNANRLAKSFGFRYYNFIQPVPYYGYPNRLNDPVSDQRDLKQYAYAYPALEEHSKSDPSTIFLGNLLKEEKGTPFVDLFHYTPQHNQLIAIKMLETLISSMGPIS